MKIIAKRTLQNFWEIHPKSKQPLLSWYQILNKNDFETVNDIRKIFGSADFVGNNVMIFNICGNHYRLIVRINFITKIVYIKFIGTHEEYDKYII